MGFELVEVSYGAGGLLRVDIDRNQGITVDDCETVTRQLQYMCTAESIEYERLEVGSAGLDRPLSKPEHFDRFVGSTVQVRLHQLRDDRKQFTGVLAGPIVPMQGQDFRFSVAVESDTNRSETIEFEYGDVKSVRLVPNFNFGGRKK